MMRHHQSAMEAQVDFRFPTFDWFKPGSAQPPAIGLSVFLSQESACTQKCVFDGVEVLDIATADRKDKGSVIAQKELCKNCFDHF